MPSSSGRGFDEEEHDEETPADTAWSTEANVTCPYCGESVAIALDPGGGSTQTYVEDCQVCCQPWQVHVSYDDLGEAQVWVEAE